MNEELERIRNRVEQVSEAAQSEAVSLFPGIELLYFAFETTPFSVRHAHHALGNILQINYCRRGQMEWRMANGQYIYLNPGDYSLHTTDTCRESSISFPTGQYAGLTVCLDLQETAVHPPALLQDADIFGQALQEKFCPDHTVAFLAGNEQTESIFSAFYDQPERLKLPYQRVKVLELLLYLARLELAPQKQLTAYRPEQIELIQKIHDRLIGQMNERLTIEELSKQYLINPTTLKTAFKAVYGTSIAAHIKEHRMEQAAKMLRETDMRVADIAKSVGYDSQSRFSAAFKAAFGVLPREYRLHGQLRQP